MIERRPERVSDFAGNALVPKEPFPLDWGTVPDLVRQSLEPLTGIRPPLSGEQDGLLLSKNKNGKFQIINLVATMGWWSNGNDRILAKPVTISLVPASKRGVVTTVDADVVQALRGAPVEAGREEVYADFDPFKGCWSLFAIGGNFISHKAGSGFIDEIGLVIQRYFLRMSFDSGSVSEGRLTMPSEVSTTAYIRNRIRVLYTPFKAVGVRRLWGLETPIELFLAQELFHRGFSPSFQYIVFQDGNAYPSLYDAYADVEFRFGSNVVTEIDIFFPQERLAVFCDGSHHGRSAQIKKDAQIIKVLADMGIKSVRVPSHLIRTDLKAAGDMVEGVLKV
jgi:hypothetical protein